MSEPGIQPDLPPQRGPRPAQPMEPMRDVNLRKPDDFLPTLIPYRNPKGLVSYYCGVFALIPCLGLLLGPVALVFGILGARHATKNPAAKGMAHSIVGIVLGSIAMLGNTIALIVILVNAGFLKAFFRVLGS